MVACRRISNNACIKTTCKTKVASFTVDKSDTQDYLLTDLRTWDIKMNAGIHNADKKKQYKTFDG